MSSGDAGSPLPPPPPQVIIIEDDRVLTEMLEFGLKSRGYRYQVFPNGQDALQALVALEVGDSRPLVLLDVDLPGMDGHSLLQRLNELRPSTYRVVFTSGHTTEEDQMRGLQAGAIDYLVKPISLRVALEKIGRWVPLPPAGER
jgi:two-component system, response regulator FlrC